MSYHQFVTRSDLVEIRIAEGMGRGVFAVAPIPSGTLVFSNPVVLLPESQCLNVPELDSIVYRWSDIMEDGKDLHAIALGLGTILNHSRSPNVVVDFAQNPDRLDFYALRDIDPGEQLLQDYQYDEYPAGWTH